ncbi:MAG TPA: hypothetical protein D7I03_06780 [Candidatus Poseidoniales archaeon]|nr:MAG TPA: hypothetical protein D7I03_06780 [Candidatus Poseidoniales archaeon]
MIGLLCASIFAIAPSVAHPPESKEFKNQHTGVDFPVGFADLTANGKSVRVIYPAMNDGEDEAMAGNGPFPFTVFFCDEGEDTSDYGIFSSEIVKRGTIVVLTNGFDSDDTTNVESSLLLLESIIDLMNQTNATNSLIPAAFGNIDLHHWGVSGHGTGAAIAYSVYPFWPESNLSVEIQPPRSIFGLGIDFSGWNSGDGWQNIKPSEWQIDPASPGTGLFMTGTVDEIAKGQDNLPIISATDALAWQWMHVLGADHYQFQDEIDDGIFFGDDRGDGDASISQTEQIDYAISHIVPYLDLTLRGVHDEFRPAFNREASPNSASDSDSYTEENLFESEFLLIENITKSPSQVNEFGRYDTFSLSSNWTLRNGDRYGEIDSNWQIDVECGFNKIVTVIGLVHDNGTVQCDYAVEDLAPGNHTAFLTVMVEGAPSTIEHQFLRTDSPISLTVPAPVIQVPERGEGYILASDIGIDPDGQELFIVEATLSGGQISNFSIQIDNDYRGLTVTHIVTEEYILGAEVDILLRSDGLGVIDEALTMLEIVVIPYNDPVVKTDDIVMQTLIEDGPSVSVNITEYAYDPEGEPLLASINDETQGIAGPVEFSYYNGVLTLNPVPNANGATVLHVRVTDGVTEPVDLDIPIQVAPVDDPVIANNSMWQISMQEDESISLSLSDFAYDIDGDTLSWTIESDSSSANVAIISGSQLIISPQNDYFGTINNEWLNVTDGTTNYSQLLSIEVTSVPDIPILTLMNVNIIDDTAATLAWSVFDNDGASEHGLEISLDGVPQDNLQPSCIIDDSGNSKECVTMLEVPVNRSETVEVRVAIFDSEFTSEVVEYTIIDFNSTVPIAEDKTDEDDGFKVSNTLIVSGVLGLIIMVLVLIIVLRTMRSEPINTNPLMIETEVDVVEEELGVSLSETGLLSRINKNK